MGAPMAPLVACASAAKPNSKFGDWSGRHQRQVRRAGDGPQLLPGHADEADRQHHDARQAKAKLLAAYRQHSGHSRRSDSVIYTGRILITTS